MKYYNYPDPRGTEVAEDVDSKNISQYGGGGGALVVNFTIDDVAYTNTSDKTAKEIFDAACTGPVVFIVNETTVCPLICMDYSSNNGYQIKLSGIDNRWLSFVADSDNATSWTEPM